MEIFILTAITGDNHICLHDKFCVAYANVTTTLGVSKPPVDGKIALIFRKENKEMEGFWGPSLRYLD